MPNKPERHALYGASSADRWLNCPASVAMSRLCPPRPPNPYMLRGAQLHEEAATFLNKYKDDPTIKFNGSPEIAAYVVQCQQLCDIAHNEYGEFSIECNVEWDDNCFTSIDCLAIDDNAVWILDLKTGNNDVSPVDNWQLKMCAILLWGPNGGLRFYREQIHLGIHQGGETKWWSNKGSIVYEWAEDFKRRLDISRNHPTVSPNAGDWCKYCTAACACPAKRNVANAATKHMTVPIGSLSPEQIGNILRLKTQVVDWLDAVEEAGLTMAKAGVPPQGYHLAPGRKRPMQWTDKVTIDNAPKEYLESKLKTPTQVAKMLGKDGEDKLIKSGEAIRPEPNDVLVSDATNPHTLENTRA